MAALFMLRPGMFTTVQDLGRWGLQSRGVPVSGAMDWYSHRLANHLVGNDPGLAALEVTLVGPHIRFDGDASFAVAGASFELSLDDRPIEMHRAIQAKPGSVLKFGSRLNGARAYVAFAGGVDVANVFGSRSTHVLSRMGGFEGRALRAGDRIGIADQAERPAGGSFRPLFSHSPLPAPHARLRMIATENDLTAYLTSRPFRVSPASNRMGYRLEGGAIDISPGERISTAVPTGAIQVPPSGQPILLMNDHATTGGYAIAGAVITADLPIAGQLAPGDLVQFEACSIDVAVAELRQREAQLGAG